LRLDFALKVTPLWLTVAESMGIKLLISPHIVLLTVIIVACGMIGISPVASAADAESLFLAVNESAMDKMMAGMTIKLTGDADHDFVAMMVPHHQGAIDMAEAELRYGHNRTLVRVAQEIVVNQLQEVAAMRLAIGEPATPTWTTGGTPKSLLFNVPASKADAALVRQSDAAMDKMMTGMAVKPTGDIDHDFVAMMVPHHQGAIDMAEAQLRYGRNEKLRRIAQEIIVDQQSEIAMMRLAIGEQPSFPGDA